MIDVAKRFFFGAGVGILGYFPNESLAQLIHPQICKNPIDFSLVDRDVKIQCLCLGIVFAPIYEEVFYRGVLQGVVLKKISQRTFPSILAKGIQIVATSLLFACPHPNKENALLLGLELGMIKESKLRLAGSIGAHMSNNCLSLRPLFCKGELV